jgi:lambda family phage minor tail protein L
MPLGTNAAFKEEGRKRSTQPIFLYSIFDVDDNGLNKYFAAYDSNVIFGDPSVEYIKFPITHDAITENSKGEIDNVKVQLSNIARYIEYYLQNYDLRGKKVSIRMVFANLLDDPDAYIEFSNYIDSYSSDVKNVMFNLMSKFDILDVTIPGRIFIQSHCQWVFKSTECGYGPGGESSCNKTRGRCRQLANQARFGAFPSTPGGTAYA